MLAGAPLPAPESFVPELWPFAFYGLYYWLGWQSYGNENWLTRFQENTVSIAIASAILFSLYYRLMPELNLEGLVTEPRASNWQMTVALSALTAYLSASLTLLSLLLGQRYLQWQSGGLRFLADASYWVI